MAFLANNFLGPMTGLNRLGTESSSGLRISHPPFAPGDFSQPLRLLMADCGSTPLNQEDAISGPRGQI
ncbi:hypothetical protein PROAA_200002 [Candidatus Propionivibrio aalborgensis]|uniref:Uncharacterized protein n=1 Tax=Candidatus Propionivibrio aalborgensis TaxID=1860101 RepID=A0A1A8XQK2_9RHOO|nr:hypothetical protein PROAA_200002 [Candidatus Propionivibrio aalborgensis]